MAFRDLFENPPATKTSKVKRSNASNDKLSQESPIRGRPRDTLAVKDRDRAHDKDMAKMAQEHQQEIDRVKTQTKSQLEQKELVHCTVIANMEESCRQEIEQVRTKYKVALRKQDQQLREEKLPLQEEIRAKGQTILYEKVKGAMLERQLSEFRGMHENQLNKLKLKCQEQEKLCQDLQRQADQKTEEAKYYRKKLQDLNTMLLRNDRPSDDEGIIIVKSAIIEV